MDQILGQMVGPKPVLGKKSSSTRFGEPEGLPRKKFVLVASSRLIRPNANSNVDGLFGSTPPVMSVNFKSNARLKSSCRLRIVPSGK